MSLTPKDANTGAYTVTVNVSDGTDQASRTFAMNITSIMLVQQNLPQGWSLISIPLLF